MKLFWAYIKQHKKAIALFCLSGAILIASFALYRLPWEAVLYPVLLCAFLGVLFMAADLARVRRLHRRLNEIKACTAAMIDALPEAAGIAEADYREIVCNLKRELGELETADAIRYQEMIEYYTVWAHQIKTPIAAMRLTLQNEDSALSRRLSSELLRIEQYVEMVLAFLRLDAASNDYVFKEYELDEIIKNAVKKFATEFIERRLRLIYEPVDRRIVTDEKWLSFVLEQVLSNALKYTREGSITIFMAEPDTLCIRDTGMGIAPEDLPRIFEKGYTGRNGRRDKAASGIGLYLCKRICRNLNGDIEAESRPGEGTVIRIRLEQQRRQRD